MKRSFDASLFHTRSYSRVNQEEEEEYHRDDYGELQKYFIPDATEREQELFEKDLDEFAETQQQQPVDVFSNHIEKFVIEFTKLKAYEDIRDDIYMKIRQHPYLLFCEQGLEDVITEFKDDEEMERYLRSMAGIEPNIKQQDDNNNTMIECRFVTKVVQEAELEDVEELEDEDIENFDGTTLKGSESTKAILEANNMDDLSSSIEDYCIIELYHTTNPLKITGWKLRINAS